MSPPLPAKAALARLLAGLTEHLPGQLDVVLAHPRYQDEAAALSRLSAAEWRRSAVDALSEQEIAWLSETLSARWAAVGEVVLPPACAVVGPSEVWISSGSRAVVLEAVTAGLAGEGSATWTVRGADHEGPRLELEVGLDDDVIQVHLSLIGRTDTSRVLLDATHAVRRRTPTVLVEEERRVLVVHDQHGLPGAGLVLEVAGRRLRTDAHGRVVLEDGLPEGEITVVG